MFKLTDVLPRKAKIAEMENDKKLRGVMVSLEAKEQNILEKKPIDALRGNEWTTQLKWQGLPKEGEGKVDEKR